MRLLFLYVKSFRVLNEAQFNFDARDRFEFRDSILYYHGGTSLPNGFFRLNDKSQGAVTGVTVAIGENGTGKTSLAAILDEIFSGRDVNEFEYVLVYEIRDKTGGERFYCINNVKSGFAIDPRVAERFESKPCDDRPQLVYFSPCYSFQGSVFREREDGESPSRTLDLSTTAYVNRALLLEPKDKKQVPGGIIRLNALRSDELKRVIDFAADFGQKRSELPDDELPLPLPDRVTISMNGDYAAANSNALAMNARKNSGLAMADWFKQAFNAFAYSHVPDLVLQLISIWQGDEVTFYATQRDVEGVYAYNDQWVKYGLEVSSLLGFENPRLKWKSLSHEQQQAVRDKAMDLIVSMFEDFPKMRALHVRRKGILRKLNERMYSADADLSWLEAGEEPDVLGSVVTLELKISNESDRGLIYDLLGNFYTSRNGRYALDVTFGHMSSGEMAYLSMLSRLYESIKQKTDDNDEASESVELGRHVVLFLDEAETTLHPAWQRKLLYNLVWYVENFMRGRYVHLIFASHSPLLASDVPLQNVILLCSKERDVAMRGIQSMYEGQWNTFGANVFDLLRISFEMEDGVMGAWAKKKLDGLLSRIKENGALSGDDVALGNLFGNRFIRGYLSKWYETNNSQYTK